MLSCPEAQKLRPSLMVTGTRFILKRAGRLRGQFRKDDLQFAGNTANLNYSPCTLERKREVPEIGFLRFK